MTDDRDFMELVKDWTAIDFLPEDLERLKRVARIGAEMMREPIENGWADKIASRIAIDDYQYDCAVALRKANAAGASQMRERAEKLVDAEELDQATKRDLSGSGEAWQVYHHGCFVAGKILTAIRALPLEDKP